MRGFFLFLCFTLSCFAADFDCAFVGSSPFSLLEAIYQARLGKRVIILEKADKCGGAWRTLTVCGIPEIDLGCHEIGSDPELEWFLTRCVGCHLVSLEQPQAPFTGAEGQAMGFYFSKGCAELIAKLEDLLYKANVPVMLNTRVSEVVIEPDKAILKTTQGEWSAERVCITPRSAFSIREGDRFFPLSKLNKQSFYHFYLLIEDPADPSFSYATPNIQNVHRVMNLTHFTCLQNSGRHLLIVQTRSKKADPLKLFEELQKKELISEKAVLLQHEFYVYERHNSIQQVLHELDQGKERLEMLQIERFTDLSQRVPQWRNLSE